ncbi:MAG: ribonuclease H-like domain-containing protein [Anaerolineae bacterium]
MDPLRERLRRLGMRSASELKKPASRPRRVNGPPLERLVGGRWVDVLGRRCLVVEQRYPLCHVHGVHRLGDALAVPADEWSPFVRRYDDQPMNLRRALFIDTETTGLGRGAGTYAFMVGLGLYEGDEFVVRQYFMPDPADEIALLELLGRDLADRDGLVSFNGRCFDWPIIETRYRMSHGAPPHRGEPHLDLLFPARRLWRRTLSSCALAHLERVVLDVAREGQDVPGYLIPQLYQDYLRLGRTEPLAGVFYHNAVDVLSMVALAGKIGAVLNAAPRRGENLHRDPLSLGRFYESCGRDEEAIEAYRQAGLSRRQADRSEAARRLSFLFKRLGRYDEAMEIWQSRLGGDELYPYIELAKQLEHRLKDYVQARHIIIQAIAWVQQEKNRIGNRMACQMMADLEHRLVRIERRISRATDS